MSPNTPQIKLTREDIACELARRSKRIDDFAQAVKGYFKFCDFNKQIFFALSQFYEQVKRGERPILIIQAPPQHGKSDMVSRIFPAWLFGLNQNIRIAGCSYSQDYASGLNRDVQNIMMSTAYKRIFPNVRLNEKKVSYADNGAALKNSARFEIVGHDGYYICAGVGGPLTGRAVDIGIIDDPIKNMAEAYSEATQKFLIDWYSAVFLTRLSKNSGQLIMATRWAVRDFIGYILDKYPPERVKVLSFPAINENGEALFPEVQPLAKLLEVKEVLSPSIWEALYQQRPIVEGGNIFKQDMFDFVDIPADMQFDFTFSMADLAAKDGQENDYTVFTDFGVKDNELYILQCFRDKIDAKDIETALRPFVKQAATYWGYRKAWIEPKMHGIYLNQKFFEEGLPVADEKELKDFFKDRNLSKTERARNAVAQLGNKKIHINRVLRNKEVLLNEVLVFPAGMHDDFVDTLIDGIKKTYTQNDGPKVFWI